MRLRAPRNARRGAGLTPMVDVVFLLVFFFMLASRFGAEAALPLDLAGSDGAWTGPPRLVEVGAGELRLNGVTADPAGLAASLDGLVETRADAVVIAPLEGAATADLAAVLATLGEAGFSALAVAR